MKITRTLLAPSLVLALGIAAPVTYDDSSEARNTAACAISTGSPVRPSMVLPICRWCISLPASGE